MNEPDDVDLPDGLEALFDAGRREEASEAERADWQQHGRDITDMSDYGYERPDFGTDAKAAPAE